MERKTATFILIVLLICGLIYFFVREKEVEYLAPAKIETPQKLIDNTLRDAQGNVIQGEFGDDQVYIQTVVPERPKRISGKYYYSEDAKSQFAGKICFEPSSEVVGIGKRFCLTNADEAYALLEISKGFSNGNSECTVNAPATIEIKSYTKLTGDADGYDSAILTNVVKTGTESFLACGKY